MAFGKNPKGLETVGSFRQTSRTFTRQRNEKKFKSGGGGKTPTWVNEYRPPTDDVDTIRLLAGSYTVEDVDPHGNLVQSNGLAYWPFLEHFDARSKRRCVCSAGPYMNDKTKRNPCHGCDLFWSSMKVNPSTGKREKGFMGRRDMAAFTMIDFGNYHKVEQVDGQGNLKINENTQQPYFNWVKCKKSSEGRGVCDACDAGKETRQGHRQHWPMGSDHYTTLIEYDETVGKCCATCSGRDTIRNEAWLCQNPECGEGLIDEHSRLTKKEIDEIVNHPVTCQHCKHEGFLSELISCVNCTPNGKSPKRATIFDVDLRIKRVEPADGTNRTSLSIVGFSDPRPIDKKFSEIAKPEELNKIYAPTPLEVQASLFQVATTTPARTPVTASRGYGQGGPTY